MSKPVTTILRTINGSDKKTITLPRVVQTSKLLSSNGGPSTPLNKGTTTKNLAGKNPSGEKKKTPTPTPTSSEPVKTIRTASRPIDRSDKKTKTLSKVAVHKAVISETGSGRYVTENTNKSKDGGVQTSKFSSSKGWTMGPPTPVNKGTTIKDLEKSAGKGKPYCLVNLPGTSGNCETTEKKIMVKHSKDRDALK
ncbi:hypothetical protein RclHR1_02680009 [Rhizophagus clarus]|nr:hypothetical protein RclHR1_02680009 [Rhizophagus clarus]